MDSKKKQYQSPVIEVIKMEGEGPVMAGSANAGSGYGPGTWSTGTARRPNTRSYGAASTSDLEDLINDILTIKE